jgi:hypothetical protein
MARTGPPSLHTTYGQQQTPQGYCYGKALISAVGTEYTVLFYL